MTQQQTTIDSLLAYARHLTARGEAAEARANVLIDAEGAYEDATYATQLPEETFRLNRIGNVRERAVCQATGLYDKAKAVTELVVTLRGSVLV